MRTISSYVLWKSFSCKERVDREMVATGHIAAVTLRILRFTTRACGLPSTSRLSYSKGREESIFSSSSKPVTSLPPTKNKQSSSTYSTYFVGFPLESRVLMHVSLDLDRWRCDEHDVWHVFARLDRLGSLTLTINNDRISNLTPATSDMRTHPFNGPLSGTTRVSWYQRGKTNLDFTQAKRQ